jgi:hypothetical protein
MSVGSNNTDYHPKSLFRQQDSLNRSPSSEHMTQRSEHAKMNNLRLEWQTLRSTTPSQGLDLKQYQLNPSPIINSTLLQVLLQRLPVVNLSFHEKETLKRTPKSLICKIFKKHLSKQIDPEDNESGKKKKKRKFKKEND